MLLISLQSLYTFKGRFTPSTTSSLTSRVSTPSLMTLVTRPSTTGTHVFDIFLRSLYTFKGCFTTSSLTSRVSTPSLVTLVTRPSTTGTHVFDIFCDLFTPLKVASLQVLLCLSLQGSLLLHSLSLDPLQQVHMFLYIFTYVFKSRFTLGTCTSCTSTSLSSVVSTPILNTQLPVSGICNVCATFIHLS